MGRQTKFFKQHILWRVTLQQQGKFDFAQQPVIHIVHLGIAGEQHKRSTTRNLEQTPDAVRCPWRELRSTWIRQIRRHIKHGLTGIIEMGLENYFTHMLESEAAPHVLETSTNGQRSGSQYSTFQLIEQTGLEDRRDINRRGLEEYICSTGAPSAAPPLNPENRVAVLGFHYEAKLHL